MLSVSGVYSDGAVQTGKRQLEGCGGMGNSEENREPDMQVMLG